MNHTFSVYQAALREVRGRRPDIGRVKRLLNRALAAGNPDAAYALGTWYLFGHHLPRDDRKAFRLLRDAAHEKVADAFLYVAMCYEKGVGTRTNLSRAFEYYVRAALNGETQAVYEVGRCLYHGLGVAKSRRLAWLWLDRARELGVVEGSEKSLARKAAPRRSPRPRGSST